MSTLLHLTVGRRLGAALAALLLLLGAVAGVSALQLRRVDADVDALRLADAAQPSTSAMYQLQRAIDDVRGLTALHLLARGSDQRSALDRQIQARRQAIGLELAACERRLADDTDRRNHEAVKSRLAALWQTLDRLLATSRRIEVDADAAEQARQLLAGDAQRAFEALGQALEAWWSYGETRRQDATRRDHAAARQGLWLLSVFSGLALLMGGLAVAWITRPSRPLTGARPDAPSQRDTDAAPRPSAPALPPPGAALPANAQEAGRRIAAGSEALAAQADVLALEVAVTAARIGEAGPGLAALARAVRNLAQLAACVAAGTVAWRDAAVAQAAAAPGAALAVPAAVDDGSDPAAG